MDTPLERGRKLGRKYTLWAFVTVAGGFTLWTSQQLIFSALGVGAAPLPAEAPSTPVAASCEGRLRTLNLAIERAIVAASGAGDEASASSTYAAALSPEWDEEKDAEARCSSVEHGADAYATLLRLRGAGEELARKHARELGPLRREVAVYLPPGGHPK